MVWDLIDEVEEGKLRLHDTSGVTRSAVCGYNVFCIVFVLHFVTKNKLLEENVEKAAWSAR